MQNTDYESDQRSRMFIIIYCVIAAVILLCILAYCQYRKEPPKVEQPVVQVYSVPVIHPAEKPVIPVRKKAKRHVDTTCVPNGIDCGAIMTINGQPVTDEMLRLYY